MVGFGFRDLACCFPLASWFLRVKFSRNQQHNYRGFSCDFIFMATFRKVKLYTVENCPHCNLARAFLARHGVQYEELNVSDNHFARAEMASASHQFGVPVLVVDDEVYVGFDRRAYEEMFKIREV